MGFDKLREWVGTMTGKGDRWGRDSVGRSAPAFMAASTTVLPPLTCTVRGRRHLRLCFCSEAGHLWPFVLRPEPGGESAGCGCLQLPCSAGCVCLRCCSAGFLLPATLCLPCPLPFSTVAPVQFALCLPVHFKFCFIFASFAPVHPCAPGSSVRASGLFSDRASSLQAARLSRWQLQHGPAVAARAPVHFLLTYLFPAESIILGHGLV